MTPLRIVMVAPTPFFSDRGCHVRILEEARALQKLGARVTVCTYFLGDTPPDLDVRRGRRVGGYNKRSAGPSWTKPLLDVDLWRVVRAVVREQEPHVLHAHLHEGMAIAALVPNARKRVLDYQGSLTQELLGYGMPRWLQPLSAGVEGWIDRRATCIVASHDQAARDLQETFGIASERITVTQDAGTLPPVDPTRVRELREQWKLDPGKLIILYTGLLGEHQGTPLLLDLARAVRDRVLDATILVCGYPDAVWREAAERRNLLEVMRFSGRFAYTDYADILKLAGLAVSPKTSLTEGNQKLYAYLQAGLPLVAFDTPVNRAIVGNAGILVDPGHPQAFVTETLDLVLDAERRGSYANLATGRAREHGSWEDVARRLVKAYGDS